MTIVITTRNGDPIEEPTPEHIAETIASLFSDGEIEATGEEPNVWISYGIERGEQWQEHTLGYYQSGLLMYTVYDREEDLDPSFEVQSVVERATAESLWTLLFDGKTDEVRDYTWDKA